MSINAKEREEKERQRRRAKKREGIEAQRVKFSAISRAINVLIGDEEQKIKQKKKEKRKNRRQGLNPATLDY